MNPFSSVDLALAVLCAYVGFHHLALYLNKKTEVDKLHFAALCFLIAVNDVAAIGLYDAGSVESGTRWQRLQFFCTAGISIAFVNFTYDLVGRKSDLPKKILLALSAAALAVGVIWSEGVLDADKPLRREVTIGGYTVTYLENQPGPIWNALFVVVVLGMCYLYWLLIRAFVVESKRDLAPLLVGFLLFFVSGVVDILISVNVIVFLYTVQYAFLVMVLTMDYVLLKRFLGVFREAETLNVRLEEKVQERTHEITRIAEELRSANELLESKNDVLRELSERDGLSGLLNHAAFHVRLSEVFHMAARERFPLGVMIIDIDHFKRINDTYGHQVGDAVIKAISACLSSGLRDYDIKAHYERASRGTNTPEIAGRYGGDEFALAVPFCGEQESRRIAERICSRVRGALVERMPALQVTCSVGCAVLVNHRADQDPLDLLRAADAALYEAKRRGRNQESVVVV
jgi:diguanylate cyclase (GGDEF)-like protein